MILIKRKGRVILFAVSCLFGSLAGCSTGNVGQYETTEYTEPVEILLHGYAIADLNIYTQPDNSSEICGQLHLGSYIMIEMIQGNWCRISGGWIPLEGVYYRQIGTAWPAIMEGYVRPDHTTLLQKPDPDAESTATYYNGDSVLICLVAGRWGLTQDGWIYMDHVNITKTYSEEDYLPTEPENEAPENEYPRPTIPQQTENSKPAQDKSYLLEGLWYSYQPTASGMYYINSAQFHSGSLTTNHGEYFPETGKLTYYGGSEGVYTFDGQTLTYLCPPYTSDEGDKSTIRISGNTMYWGSLDLTYYRISWKELEAKIKAETSSEDLGPGDIDPAILGSWYVCSYAPKLDAGAVTLLYFYADGTAVDEGIYYDPATPKDTSGIMGSYPYDFRFVGNTLQLRDGTIENDKFETVPYRIEGNILYWGSSSIPYKYGTVKDAFAEIEKERQEYLQANTKPTQPQE